MMHPTLTRPKVIAGVAILVLAGAFVIFSRARTVNQVCQGLQDITHTINHHDHPALRDFIGANVEARQHTADLAREEGSFAEAHLQHSVAVQYREIGERFTPLPAPTC